MRKILVMIETVILFLMKFLKKIIDHTLEIHLLDKK